MEKVINTDLIENLIAPYLHMGTQIGEEPESLDHYNLRILTLKLKVLLDSCSKEVQTFYANNKTDEHMMNMLKGKDREDFKDYVYNSLYARMSNYLAENHVGKYSMSQHNELDQTVLTSLQLQVIKEE